MARQSRPGVATVLLYHILRAVLRVPVGVFFRQVEVIGRENVADEGARAVLLCGNHPNSLLDPLLIIVTSPREVRFAAKDVLFKTWPMRMLLRGVGAVPVQRRMDHGNVNNSLMFDAMSQVLAGGGAMGIFPEGLSHDEAQLQKLKTGAARIALETGHKHDQLVDVVPVGLTYIHPKRFRSRVVVWYGAPIEVGETWRDAFLRDDRAAARKLTEEIDTALRELTVNAEDWDTARVLNAVRRLYQPQGIQLWQRVELARRFNAAYPQVKDFKDVQAMLTRVRAYLVRLRELDLDDKDVLRRMGNWEIAGKCALCVLDAVVWAPLALPGLLLQGPVALLIGVLGSKLSPRKDVIATTKLMMGLALVPLLHLCLITVVAWLANWRWAALLAVLLPLSGYAALRALETGVRVWEMLQKAGKILILQQELRTLRAERDALQADVERLVDKYRPADMELLFARPSPPEN